MVLKALFWILAAPTGALALILLLMTLGGRRLSAATPLWLALLAAVGVLALLVWAHRVAALQQRPGWACAIVAGSWVLFAVVMTVNGLLRQTTWN